MNASRAAPCATAGYGTYSFWLESCGDDLTPRPALDGSTDVDVAILGGGYTGLWTAYYLLKSQPALRVAIVERQIAGFGASGRNGGWCSSKLNIGLDAVAGRAYEDSSLAPLPRPDGRRTDGPGPGIPLAHGLRRRGQHVDVVVGEDPVLLGDQVEVADAPGNWVLSGHGQHVDPIRNVVVRLLASPQIRMLAGMAGKLTADQVQVI